MLPTSLSSSASQRDRLPLVLSSLALLCSFSSLLIALRPASPTAASVAEPIQLEHRLVNRVTLDGLVLQPGQLAAGEQLWGWGVALLARAGHY